MTHEETVAVSALVRENARLRKALAEASFTLQRLASPTRLAHDEMLNDQAELAERYALAEAGRKAATEVLKP